MYENQIINSMETAPRLKPKPQTYEDGVRLIPNPQVAQRRGLPDIMETALARYSNYRQHEDDASPQTQVMDDMEITPV